MLALTIYLIFSGFAYAKITLKATASLKIITLNIKETFETYMDIELSLAAIGPWSSHRLMVHKSRVSGVILTENMGWWSVRRLVSGTQQLKQTLIRFDLVYFAAVGNIKDKMSRTA